jgi:DNA-binding MarR family transcriptional regulator
MSTDDGRGTALWLQWKRTTERLKKAVVADVTAAAPVSDVELTVLVLLDEAGGALRQSALVATTGWDRTRASHLLQRMETRGYLARERLRNGVELQLAPGGQDVLASTRPMLRGAVERHLLSKLSAADLHNLQQILDRLGPATPTSDQDRGR